MNWSDLRARIRENLSPDIRDRIDFHVTVYRKSHDSAYGRAWITIDRKQVASWSDFEHLIKTNFNWIDEHRFPLTNTPFHLEEAKYSKKDFLNILTEFLNLNPRNLLSSSVPLARALAVADRRIGKRTLKEFPIREEQDPLVLLLFALRMGAARVAEPLATPNDNASGPKSRS